MYTFLIIILILVCLVVLGAVLLQAGKGGGLASSFGGASTATDSLIGTRQAGNLLTKLSWWGGGIFLLLAFVLQLMSVRTRAPTSVLDKAFAPAPAAPAPTGATGGATAIPLQPNTPPKAAETPPPTPNK
jgi:preprotein translocase subunit SecG